MSIKIDLQYQPPPPRPEWFDRELAKIVPVCPGDSSQRYLRFVWGCDRIETKGARNRRRYADPEMKYVGMPRWILEGWQSSDVYSRADWKNYEHLLGEFPNNGVWDFIEVHEDADGNYLPLDTLALERAQSWNFWRSKGNKRSVEEFLRRLEKQDELEAKWRREEADKVLDSFVEDAARAQQKDLKNVEFSLPSGMKQTESGLIIPG